MTVSTAVGTHHVVPARKTIGIQVRRFGRPARHRLYCRRERVPSVALCCSRSRRPAYPGVQMVQTANSVRRDAPQTGASIGRGRSMLVRRDYPVTATARRAWRLQRVQSAGRARWQCVGGDPHGAVVRVTRPGGWVFRVSRARPFRWPSDHNFAASTLRQMKEGPLWLGTRHGRSFKEVRRALDTLP
jgi:hypothetical protein